MNNVEPQYVNRRSWRTLLNNNNRLFIFIVLISISLAQNADPIKIFNPDGHRDVQPNWPVIINDVFPGDNALDSILTTDTIHWVTEGYRVQVLASKSMTKADSLSTILNDTLQDSIYVVYETPNYKVRIGDYIVREDAEETRQYLNNIGYPSAWIIRSRITPQRTGMIIRNY